MCFETSLPILHIGYPRYYSNCGYLTTIRPFSRSDKRYALTQQAREGSTDMEKTIRSSFQLRSYLQKDVPIGSHQPPTLCRRLVSFALSFIAFV